MFTKILVFSIVYLFFIVYGKQREIDDKKKCPKVNSITKFDLHQVLGDWYVVEYYANSEEYLIYECMRALFSFEKSTISMKFNYSFLDDPDNEKLFGNITWRIPDMNQPAHWVHAEDTYEGVYNTYVLDQDKTEKETWLLLLHCAEKTGSLRYLSSFIMARQKTLSVNVVSYLKDKLVKYHVDLQYLFPMNQNECISKNVPLYYAVSNNNNNNSTLTVPQKNPLNHL